MLRCYLVVTSLVMDLLRYFKRKEADDGLPDPKGSLSAEFHHEPLLELMPRFDAKVIIDSCKKGA